MYLNENIRTMLVMMVIVITINDKQIIMIMMNSKGRDRALGTVDLEYSDLVDICFMINVDMHIIHSIHIYSIHKSK